MYHRSHGGRECAICMSPLWNDCSLEDFRGPGCPGHDLCIWPTHALQMPQKSPINLISQLKQDKKRGEKVDQGHIVAELLLQPSYSSYPCAVPSPSKLWLWIFCQSLTSLNFNCVCTDGENCTQKHLRQGEEKRKNLKRNLPCWGMLHRHGWNGVWIIPPRKMDTWRMSLPEFGRGGGWNGWDCGKEKRGGQSCDMGCHCLPHGPSDSWDWIHDTLCKILVESARVFLRFGCLDPDIRGE